MRSVDVDAFRDNYLRFSLRKPRHWQFLPPAWSPTAQLKNSSDSACDWIHYASLPFCCAMLQHASDAHAYPTLQVTARPFALPSNQLATSILDTQISHLSEIHRNFELIDATAEALIGGHRANIIHARFSLMSEPPDRVPIEFSILSRSIVVFSPSKAFTLGLSSSTDQDYFDESDFSGIVASVRVGT